MKKFEEAGEVTNIERPVQYHFARSAKNIAIASESVAEDPNVSLSGIRTVLRYIMMHSAYRSTAIYKIQLTLQVKPADHSQSCRYVQWVLEQQAVDGNFLIYII